MATSISIIRNPANDPEFERAVNDIIRAGVRDAVTAQALLREAYPRAVIRPRGLTGEPTPVWYVYREGRWIAGDGTRE
jgi:hypothetical protein